MNFLLLAVTMCFLLSVSELW